VAKRSTSKKYRTPQSAPWGTTDDKPQGLIEGTAARTGVAQGGLIEEAAAQAGVDPEEIERIAQQFFGAPGTHQLTFNNLRKALLEATWHGVTPFYDVVVWEDRLVQGQVHIRGMVHVHDATKLRRRGIGAPKALLDAYLKFIMPVGVDYDVDIMETSSTSGPWT